MPFNPDNGDPAVRLAHPGVDALFNHADHVLGRIASHSHIAARLLYHFPITARGLAILLVGAALGVLVPPLVVLYLRLTRRVEANYRGDQVVRSYGLVTLVWPAVMLALAAWIYPKNAYSYHTFLWVVTGFGLLGFIDDSYGDRKIKGLNHFKALLRGKFTTGQLKAFGGIAVALYTAYRLQGPHLGPVLMVGAMIAMTSNGINLFDMRPGRAVAVFILAAGAVVFAQHRLQPGSLSPLVFVIIPALLVWPLDAIGQAMIGDTGSNLLGAALGTGIAHLGLKVAGLELFLVILLHAFAVKLSMTTAIEKNGLLHAIDSLTGVRLKPSGRETERPSLI